MFGNGYCLSIWEVDEKENYAIVAVSSKKKNRATNKYETDFSSKYVKFIGDAFKCRPIAGQRIRIIDCGVENVYVKDGEKFYMKNPNYIIYKYELLESETNYPSNETLTSIDNGELPF